MFSAAGKMLPIPEGYPCIVELPKGDSDLGLIVSQCERTVSIQYCIFEIGYLISSLPLSLSLSLFLSFREH